MAKTRDQRLVAGDERAQTPQVATDLLDRRLLCARRRTALAHNGSAAPRLVIGPFAASGCSAASRSDRRGESDRRGDRAGGCAFRRRAPRGAAACSVSSRRAIRIRMSISRRVCSSSRSVRRRPLRDTRLLGFDVFGALALQRLEFRRQRLHLLSISASWAVAAVPHLGRGNKVVPDLRDRERPGARRAATEKVDERADQRVRMR